MIMTNPNTPSVAGEPTTGEGLHVVVGAGAVGTAVAREAQARGHRVRLVSRTGNAVLDRIEVVKGDASDPVSAIEFTTGADVIYNATNPPYHQWGELFPPMQRALLAAAAHNGAAFIAMENVYGYGSPDGETLTEASALRPTSDKGRIRAEMWNDLREWHTAGRANTAAVRASDFYGPMVGDSMVGKRFWTPILNGKKLALLGDPDVRHTITYINDIGRALVDVASNPDTWGQAWHVPNAPAVTGRELVQLAQKLAGTTGKVATVPAFGLRIAGLFDRAAREMPEMMYQFTQDFIVDGSAHSQRFGWETTPLDEGFRTTIESLRNLVMA
jgi:nucleoside-diphosphate-sugar epimerase